MKDWYFPCALIGAALCVVGFNTNNDLLLYSATFMCIINTYAHFTFGAKS